MIFKDLVIVYGKLYIDLIGKFLLLVKDRFRVVEKCLIVSGLGM